MTCNNKQCDNPLMVHNFNLVMNLNEFFAKHPNEKIGKDDFMEIQAYIWKDVKKEMGIKIK